MVSLASVWPAAFEILAVKSFGAVHCLNKILDDNDPRYISTGDLILEANGRTDPTAMIHELLYRRCISLTLAKPRSADISSTVYAPLSEIGSCDEILTPLQLFRRLLTIILLEAPAMTFSNPPVPSSTMIAGDCFKSRLVLRSVVAHCGLGCTLRGMGCEAGLPRLQLRLHSPRLGL